MFSETPRGSRFSWVGRRWRAHPPRPPRALAYAVDVRRPNINSAVPRGFQNSFVPAKLSCFDWCRSHPKLVVRIAGHCFAPSCLSK